MTYYLGKAGALIALPDPEVGLPMTPERIGGTHQLLSGARVRDTIGRMRTWNLSWTAIDLTTYGTLESFYLGTVGPGPYYFLDPEQRNLLVPNVAASTSVTNDSTGFVAGANVTLSSVATVTTGAYPKRLQLSETTSVGIGQTVVSLATVVPVRPSVSYTFSGIIAIGTPAHFPVISWLDASRVQISETDGAVVSSTTATFAVTGTAPSNAVYADCQLRANAAPTGASTLWIEALQLERAASASAWVPGAGVPLVTVESVPRSTPLAGICDAQMTLVQVG